VDEPLYRLEVEALDLGTDVRAVGLELIERETREPVRGPEAAAVWAEAMGSLAGTEPCVLDFFAHLERVRDFCRQRAIPFREPNGHLLLIDWPAPAAAAIFERFEGETFGARAGDAVVLGDALLEEALAARGVDAYHDAFKRYLFAAVCDFEGGFLTLLSERIWASEAIRRLRGPLAAMRVDVNRPA